MSPKPEIDDASYQEGRAAFAAGASLRDVFEAFAGKDSPADDVKLWSGALGFADALLDHMRNPQTTVVCCGPAAADVVFNKS